MTFDYMLSKLKKRISSIEVVAIKGFISSFCFDIKILKITLHFRVISKPRKAGVLS